MQLGLFSPIDVPADLGTFAYAFDCGQGYGPPVSDNDVTCPTNTVDDGPVPIRAKIIDKDGGFTEYTATVAVINRSPVITALGLPATPVAAGSPVTLVATFIDPGTADTHIGEFILGPSGPIVQASVVESNGSGSMTATVTFATAGVYTIEARVRDDDGGSDTRSSASGTPPAVVVTDPVVVDPVFGSVAGTGIFNSPAGALVSNPAFTGRPAFAFGAKHLEGGALAAHLEFVIKLANFHFRSTSNQSLTFGDGVARYRGEGTVNGAGSYAFQVTAVDGGWIGSGWERLTAGDKIRVRIWNKDTGAVVYDNQPGMPESSDAASPLVIGAIVIHTR